MTTEEKTVKFKGDKFGGSGRITNMSLTSRFLYRSQDIKLLVSRYCLFFFVNPPSQGWEGDKFGG